MRQLVINTAQERHVQTSRSVSNPFLTTELSFFSLLILIVEIRGVLQAVKKIKDTERRIYSERFNVTCLIFILRKCFGIAAAQTGTPCIVKPQAYNAHCNAAKTNSCLHKQLKALRIVFFFLRS